MKYSILALFLLSGCTTTYVAYDGPCPSRPELTPIEVELQAEIAPHTLSIIANNQIKLKEHIKNLETLSGCTQ